LRLQGRDAFATEQFDQGSGALAALGTTTAGGVNLTGSGRASLGGGALHLVVGQGVAKAYIHWQRILTVSGSTRRPMFMPACRYL